MLACWRRFKRAGYFLHKRRFLSCRWLFDFTVVVADVCHVRRQSFDLSRTLWSVDFDLRTLPMSSSRMYIYRYFLPLARFS